MKWCVNSRHDLTFAQLCGSTAPFCLLCDRLSEPRQLCDQQMWSVCGVIWATVGQDL